MLFANDLVLHDEANYFPILTVTEIEDDEYCFDVSLWEPTSVVTRSRAREIDLDNVNLDFDEMNGQATDIVTSSNVVREHWEGETPEMNVLDYVSNLQEKLRRAWTFARENLTKAQATMKTNYDVGTQMRHFDPGDKVLHLDKDKVTSLTMLINDYKDLFQDSPGRTNILEHDVDVGEARPIKQSPYRLNRIKRDIVKDEVNDDWETHLKRIRAIFEVLRKAGLVVNLRKSDFAQAKVVYLGHEIGLGKVAPKKANVEAISNFPAPQNRRGVRRFLGMVGYYRKFVKNFSDIAHPLTNLLKKDVKFIWDDQCSGIV
ncbi:uncharacterized protein LOC135226230 [Macrobrachium nipponense]|uniref:uncharacterized protein LOC135226230 n=1 Tax=Macrobrachium nipponense TaxID=159736 RepID=UPI0030C7EA98